MAQREASGAVGGGAAWPPGGGGGGGGGRGLREFTFSFRLRAGSWQFLFQPAGG